MKYLHSLQGSTDESGDWKNDTFNHGSFTQHSSSVNELCMNFHNIIIISIVVLNIITGEHHMLYRQAVMKIGLGNST